MGKTGCLRVVCISMGGELGRLVIKVTVGNCLGGEMWATCAFLARMLEKGV